MTNRWVEFVRDFSKKHGITYSCAVSTPECKAEYRAKYPDVKGKKTFSKVEPVTPAKKKKSNLILVEDLDEATPSTEPVPKNITIKKSTPAKQEKIGEKFPNLIEDRISEAKEFLEKIKKIKRTDRTLNQMKKDEKKFKEEFEKLKKVGMDKYGNLYNEESHQYLKSKYGDKYATFHPTASKDKYFNSIDLLIPIWEKIKKEIDDFGSVTPAKKKKSNLRLVEFLDEATPSTEPVPKKVAIKKSTPAKKPNALEIDWKSVKEDAGFFENKAFSYADEDVDFIGEPEYFAKIVYNLFKKKNKLLVLDDVKGDAKKLDKKYLIKGEKKEYSTINWLLPFLEKMKKEKHIDFKLVYSAEIEKELLHAGVVELKEAEPEMEVKPKNIQIKKIRDKNVKLDGEKIKLTLRKKRNWIDLNPNYEEEYEELPDGVFYEGSKDKFGGQILLDLKGEPLGVYYKKSDRFKILNTRRQFESELGRKAAEVYCEYGLNTGDASGAGREVGGGPLLSRQRRVAPPPATVAPRPTTPNASPVAVERGREVSNARPVITLDKHTEERRRLRQLLAELADTKKDLGLLAEMRVPKEDKVQYNRLVIALRLKEEALQRKVSELDDYLQRVVVEDALDRPIHYTGYGRMKDY